MTNKRQIIPAAGLLAVIAIAGYMVVRLNAQDATMTGNFTNAIAAEVRDANKQVLLRGQFETAKEDDGDLERPATLEPTGLDPDASGEAEVEWAKDAPAQQEVEFTVRNLPPNTALTFAIDGVQVGTATTDSRGRAELEIDVRAK